MLYIVSTPIGNLSDASSRLKDTLDKVAVIIMESPEDSKRLLYALHISKKKQLKFNDANAKRVLPQVIDEIRDVDAAYITSAGTPGISDPGAELVYAARQEGIEVRVIPGPSAITSALALSGIRTAQFSFVGFLPRKQGAVQKIFDQHKERETVLIFLESPFRVLKTLGWLRDCAPDSYVCAAKEMTKVFERYFTGTPATVMESMSEKKEFTKGEFTIVVDFQNKHGKK